MRLKGIYYWFTAVEFLFSFFAFWILDFKTQYTDLNYGYLQQTCGRHR
jgi:hypothetical protein